LQYCFIWPEIELSLQEVIDTHDRPGGSLESLRNTCQCSIRCDTANSTIIIQGMDEASVVKAGRSFQGIAMQMVTDLSRFIRISLLDAPISGLYRSYVSMDQKVELPSSLYYLPIPPWNVSRTFAVTRPKLWIPRQAHGESTQSISEKIKRRLGRFNLRTILAGLERSLMNLSLAQKAVRMHVNFGELVFLIYNKPQSGAPNHSLEGFRKQMARERTDLMLRGCVMPTTMCTHPLLR
jgi:hypothetical protein